MLELDPRINKDKIKTILNADDEFIIGKTGYFTTNLNAFKDLTFCSVHGTLKEVNMLFDNDNVFVVKDDDGVVVSERYFIADEDLLPAEEKYRPFTLEEFVNKFDVGKIVCFRNKKQSTDTYNTIYAPSVRALVISIEYYHDHPLVSMGNHWYSLGHLFEDYELWDSKLGWIPFGVKVNG